MRAWYVCFNTTNTYNTHIQPFWKNHWLCANKWRSVFFIRELLKFKPIWYLSRWASIRAFQINKEKKRQNHCNLLSDWILSDCLDLFYRFTSPSPKASSNPIEIRKVCMVVLLAKLNYLVECHYLNFTDFRFVFFVFVLDLMWDILCSTISTFHMYAYWIFGANLVTNWDNNSVWI